MAYKFDGYVKELKVEKDKFTCKFKMDTVIILGQEVNVALKNENEIVKVEFGDLRADSDCFQFISQHCREKLRIEIDDEKKQIISVALIYG